MEKVLIEIEMENGDVMKGELYPEVAPITVENFLKLIDEDFFVLSMARTMIKDSASSQFFIMHKPAPHLDGEYAAFGKITEGLDIVDQIANVPTNFQDCPTTPVVIKAIRRA